MNRHPKPFWRDVLDMLWQQPLWALPFTAFFGVIYAKNWAGLVVVFEVSLVFAYFIRLGLMAVTWLLLPRIEPRFSEPLLRPGHFPTRSLWYSGAAMIAAYAAAVVVHFSLLPGFLGNWRQFAITGVYALLFSVLISGLGYARAFYHHALDRARAVEQARAALAEAELRALRARINPHFLFNTLNAIASLIAENPAAAEETTTRLAEAFRYTLATSERSHARFRDELDFVRGCLEIERVRFGDRLRVVEDIAPGLDDVAVPALLLQPLVENAVEHGIGARPAGGTLRIGARRDGDRLTVEVEDDGPGFDPDAPPRGDSFGLHSVRERLRLAGPPHGFELDSSPGRGTRVRVVLPIPAAAGIPPAAFAKGDSSCFDGFASRS